MKEILRMPGVIADSKMTAPLRGLTSGEVEQLRRRLADISGQLAGAGPHSRPSDCEGRTLTHLAGSEVRAGVAREVITPELGTPLIGTLRESASGTVEDDLAVTALALSSKSVTVLLLACDAVILTPEEANTIRQAIGTLLAIPLANVLVNVSHSHATPSPPAFGEYDQGESAERRAVEAYHKLLVSHCIKAAKQAAESMRPARFGTGVGEVNIAVNRREQLPDGTMVLGENQNGLTDPALGVLRVDDLAGDPIAVVVHYACHPDVLGPKTDLISPDFVGAARRIIESLTGATSLFLQGAAGDLDPRCGIVLGADGVAEMHRLGTELGCEAVRVCQEINTARRRSHRTSWPSTASVVTGWVYSDIESTSAELAVATRTLAMPLRPLPDVAQARADLAGYEARLAQLEADPFSPAWRVTNRGRQWAREQLRAVETGAEPRIHLELTAARIGELAIVGIPGEVFVEIGLAIKAASPFQQTMVCGYTNGLYFYIPTAAAFAQGGYEVESYRNYLRPAGPTPDWEALLVGEATDLLHTLTPPRKEIAS
jgi:neutral ceramidase